MDRVKLSLGWVLTKQIFDFFDQLLFEKVFKEFWQFFRVLGQRWSNVCRKIIKRMIKIIK